MRGKEIGKLNQNLEVGEGNRGGRANQIIKRRRNEEEKYKESEMKKK